VARTTNYTLSSHDSARIEDAFNSNNLNKIVDLRWFYKNRIQLTQLKQNNKCASDRT